MSIDIGTALRRASARVAQIELDMLGQLTAAYIVETGSAPCLFGSLDGSRRWIGDDQRGDVMIFLAEREDRRNDR